VADPTLNRLRRLWFDVHMWLGVGLLVVLWCAVAVTAWRAFPRERRLESLVWAAATAVFAS